MTANEIAAVIAFHDKRSLRRQRTHERRIVRKIALGVIALSGLYAAVIWIAQ